MDAGFAGESVADAMADMSQTGCMATSTGFLHDDEFLPDLFADCESG